MASAGGSCLAAVFVPGVEVAEVRARGGGDVAQACRVLELPVAGGEAVSRVAVFAGRARFESGRVEVWVRVRGGRCTALAAAPLAAKAARGMGLDLAKVQRAAQAAVVLPKPGRRVVLAAVERVCAKGRRRAVRAVRAAAGRRRRGVLAAVKRVCAKGRRAAAGAIGAALGSGGGLRVRGLRAEVPRTAERTVVAAAVALSRTRVVGVRTKVVRRALWAVYAAAAAAVPRFAVRGNTAEVIGRAVRAVGCALATASVHAVVADGVPDTALRSGDACGSASLRGGEGSVALGR